MNTQPSPGYEIPDGEILYRYFNPKIIPDGQEEIPAAIFNDPELSCDWAKFKDNPFSSYHITEGRSGVIAITINDNIRNPKNPKRSGQIVQDWHQDIVYDPIMVVDEKGHLPNNAHSLIRGPKKAAVVEAIKEASEIITPDII